VAISVPVLAALYDGVVPRHVDADVVQILLVSGLESLWHYVPLKGRVEPYTGYASVTVVRKPWLVVIVYVITGLYLAAVSSVRRRLRCLPHMD
jgi:hypothetical protein